MATFCGKCGKPLDGGRFCPACGADSAEPIAAATPGASSSMAGSSESSSAASAGAAGAGTPAYTAAAASGAAGGGVAAPRKSSNTLLIVLLIIVVIFGGIGAVVVYAAYWVKHKAMSTARDYGVELPSDAHSRRKSASAASHRDPCSFLTAAEVAAATGVAITEAHTENQTCNFASADGTGAGAFVEFEWGSGKILMTATRAGGKLMTMAPGTELQSIEGVGDEAYFQNGMLSVRHGEDGFRIMMPAELLTKNMSSGRSVLDNIAEMREMEKGLAQKVVSRMN